VSVNLYAPPATAVADVAPAPDTKVQPPFFAVSIPKFAIMCLCTFSLYEVYWFYKNWKRIAERERLGISPQSRAVFAVLFCYQCFTRIRDYRSSHGAPDEGAMMLGLSGPEIGDVAPIDVGWRLPAGALAIGWIVANLTWRAPYPYSMISMFAFLFLVPVQIYVNRLNALAAPAHNLNGRFSLWNWLIVVPGGFLMLLALAGPFLPDQP